MLINLILKEIEDHLKSLRFMLTMLLLIIMMAVSAVLFIPEYKQQMEDYSRKTNETLDQISRNAERNAAIFRVFSFNWTGPWVYKGPNHLGFISDGYEKELPNAFSPSAFRIYGPVKRTRTNLLLWRSDSLDWAIIIGIILSFASLLLVYDAVCGERENGTLRLSLVNSVSRSTILFSKFLGALTVLSIGLITGIIVNLLLLLIIGNIPITGNDWFIILISFIFSVVYISVFLMLGLFISTLSRESTTSLVVSLLSWVLLVIIIPRAGGLISSKIVKINKYSLALTNANRLRSEAMDNYNKNNPEMENSFSSGHWSPGEPLERAFVGSDAWSNAFDEYRNQMIYQVEVARKITMISPAACFQYGMEALTESGLSHYKTFFNQVKNHKLALRQFLTDSYPLPLKWHAWNSSIPQVQRDEERAKIIQITPDFESIPKFQEKKSDFPELISNSLIHFAVLMLFIVLFFTSAFVKFMKYDVR
ncbi:ABC transporter permease [candidate division KSB1 bacterium]